MVTTTGRSERLRQQPERARGAQTFGLADILDRGAERRAIAEMMLDHFGLVVHRYEDVPETLLHDVADDGFQQRPAADIEHRLRAVPRQRAEPFAESARHDENRIGIARSIEQFIEGFDADKLAAVIEQRKLLDEFLPHQMQPFFARQRCRR